MNDPLESNTNSNSLSEIAASLDKPKTREELKAELRNIIISKSRQRFKPESSTILPPNFTYKDSILRKLLPAGINPAEFMRSDRRMLPKGDNALDTIDKFTDPYTPDYKARLQNAAEFDGTIKKACRIKAWYVMRNGKNIRHKMTMETVEQFDTKQEESRYINDLFPDKEAQKSLKKYVDNVCIDSNIFAAMGEIYELSIYFGRAAGLKVFGDIEAFKERNWTVTKQYFEKTPILFQPLSPMLMGNVTVDKRSWLPTYLYYNDAIFGLGEDGKPKPAGWIKNDRMIYMARRDIHLLPNKRRYGLSDLSPLLPISELLRQIYSDVLGEAVSNLILPSLFLVFDSLDQKSMQAIIDSYQQGGIMGRNKDVEVQPIDFNVNLPAIIDLMKALQRMVYAHLEIPYLFGGDEGEFNRSVAETVTDVWQKTVLDPERDIIQDVLDGQFYGPLVSDYMDKYYRSKSYDWNTERLRFVLKFPKLDFANVVDKANEIKTLIDIGVITTRQGQLMYDSEPLDDEQTAELVEIENKLKEKPELAEKVLAYLNSLTNPTIPIPNPNPELGADNPEEQQQATIDQAIINNAAEPLRRAAENRF